MKEQPAGNPYESPQSADAGLAADRIRPDRKLQWRLIVPACILIALCIVHLLGFAFGLVRAVMFLAESAEPLNPRVAIEVFGLLNLATFLVSSGAALFIMYGAWQMIWLQSLQVCRIAAILACVPCLSPLICGGVPFGAWLLLVLFHRGATAEFERLAAARKAGTSY